MQNVPLYTHLSRRDMRSLIFHLLYAMESFEYQTSMQSIVDNLNRGFESEIPLDCEEVVISEDIIAKRDDLDLVYKDLLEKWRPERLGVATRLILRYAIWEMLYTDTSHTIVINEAVELAKCFAEKDAYKFVNGILDEASKRLNKEK